MHFDYAHHHHWFHSSPPLKNHLPLVVVPKEPLVSPQHLPVFDVLPSLDIGLKRTEGALQGRQGTSDNTGLSSLFGRIEDTDRDCPWDARVTCILECLNGHGHHLMETVVMCGTRAHYK